MASDPGLPLDTKNALNRRQFKPAFPGDVPATRNFGGYQGLGAPVALAVEPAARAYVPNDPVSARVADAENRAAGAAHPPVTQDNISAPNNAQLDALGERLPGGLKRYQMDSGNEAQVYVGRGKHGETLFTDAPNDALTRANLAGGLRKGDTGFDRTQGPRADFAYSKNSLQRGGFAVPTGKMDAGGQPITYVAPGRQDLRRVLMAANDPAQLKSYQDELAASTFNDPETRAADRILSNQLAAHQSGLKAQTAGAGAAMTPAQALGLAQLRERAAFHAKTLDNQSRAQARADNADYRNNLANAQKTGQEGNVIASRIKPGMTPEEAFAFFNSPEGLAVSTDAISALRKNAGDTTLPLEFGDTAAAKKLTFADIAFGDNGQFDGFLNDGENEFPRDGGWFKSGKYDEGLLGALTPSNLRVLKYRDAAANPEKYSEAQLAAFAKAAGLQRR